MSADAATRPLSPLERWYWIADQVSPLNVISRVRVHGPLPMPLLRRALDELQARHPLLRVAIATAPGDAHPRFVPATAPIPLRAVSPDGTDDQWVRQVDERELADRIDWRGGPLCRAAVVTVDAEPGPAGVHDLLLAMPHCVADGTTVLSLLKEWLAGAADLGGGAARPALPAAEDLIPPRYRGLPGALRLGTQLLADLYRIRRYRPARLVPSRFVPFAQRRTRLIHRSLPPAQVRALVQACRREQTTVHGALAAAMVTAVATEPGRHTPSRVAIGSPIDFRTDLAPPVPGDAAGAYVATVPSFVPYRPGAPFWSVARAISADLVRRRRRANHFAMVGLVGRSCPASAAASRRLIERVESSGPVNLCLSNLGRYDFPDALGPWRLSGAQFVAGLSVCGYFVATANTSHDRLFWNFEYVQDAVPEARAQALVAASVGVVLSAIAEPAEETSRAR